MLTGMCPGEIFQVTEVVLSDERLVSFREPIKFRMWAEVFKNRKQFSWIVKTLGFNIGIVPLVIEHVRVPWEHSLDAPKPEDIETLAREAMNTARARLGYLFETCLLPKHADVNPYNLLPRAVMEEMDWSFDKIARAKPRVRSLSAEGEPKKTLAKPRVMRDTHTVDILLE